MTGLLTRRSRDTPLRPRRLVALVARLRPTGRQPLAIAAAICTFACLQATTARAWDAREPGAAPPSLRGMAGAGIAAALGTGALFTNPAALSAQPGQNIELGLARDQRPGRTGFWVGSVDGNRGGIAGGTIYSFETGVRADGRSRSGSDWRSGIALGVHGDSASFVLGGCMRRLGLDLGAGGGEAKRSISGWTGDLGLAASLGDVVHLGAVWRDITSIDDSVAGRAETTSRVGGGLAISAGPVLLAADALWRLDDSVAQWHAGATVAIAGVVQVRAGWRLDPGSVARQLIAGGLGLRIEQYGVDVALELDPAQPSRFRFALSLVVGIPYVLGG